MKTPWSLIIEWIRKRTCDHKWSYTIHAVGLCQTKWVRSCLKCKTVEEHIVKLGD